VKTRQNSSIPQSVPKLAKHKAWNSRKPTPVKLNRNAPSQTIAQFIALLTLNSAPMQRVQNDLIAASATLNVGTLFRERS